MNHNQHTYLRRVAHTISQKRSSAVIADSILTRLAVPIRKRVGYCTRYCVIQYSAYVYRQRSTEHISSSTHISLVWTLQRPNCAASLLWREHPCHHTPSPHLAVAPHARLRGFPHRPPRWRFCRSHSSGRASPNLKSPLNRVGGAGARRSVRASVDPLHI